MNNTEMRQAIRTAMGMSPAQLNYISTKAHYDNVYPQYIKEVGPAYDVKDKGKSIQALIEVDKKFNWSAITDAKIEAEKELVEWGRNLLKEKSPERYEKVKRVFDEYLFHPQIHEQLMDLLLRLKISEVN
jgi:hypothetical protein